MRENRRTGRHACAIATITCNNDGTVVQPRVATGFWRGATNAKCYSSRISTLVHPAFHSNFNFPATWWISRAGPAENISEIGIGEGNAGTRTRTDSQHGSASCRNLCPAPKRSYGQGIYKNRKVNVRSLTRPGLTARRGSNSGLSLAKEAFPPHRNTSIQPLPVCHAACQNVQSTRTVNDLTPFVPNV